MRAAAKRWQPPAAANRAPYLPLGWTHIEYLTSNGIWCVTATHGLSSVHANNPDRKLAWNEVLKGTHRKTHERHRLVWELHQTGVTYLEIAFGQGISPVAARRLALQFEGKMKAAIAYDGFGMCRHYEAGERLWHHFGPGDVWLGSSPDRRAP